MKNLAESASFSMEKIAPVTSSARAIFLAQREERVILHISANDKEMTRLVDSLPFFAPKREIIEFPAWDTMPFDRSSPNQKIISQRVKALSMLANGLDTKKQYIIVTTLNAALQKLPPISAMSENSLDLKKGDSIKTDKLLKFFADNSYDRVSKVYEPGEFAVRGSILDVFPAGVEKPVRIDFFGDEAESIKIFDPISQISEGVLDSIRLFSAAEIILNAENIEKFKKNFRIKFGNFKEDDGFFNAISSGVKHQGYENLLPLFYDELTTIFDYVENVSRETLLAADQTAIDSETSRNEIIQEYCSARKDMSKDYPTLDAYDLYLPEIPDNKFSEIIFSPFVSEDSQKSKIKKIRIDKTNLNQLKDYKKKICFAAYSEASSKHIEKILINQGFSTKHIALFADLKNVSRETMAISIFPLEEGFESENVVFISEQDLFGDRFSRTIKKKKRSENFMAEAESFEVGELIVHEDHGIGKFAGLEILEVSGIRHEMVKLLYDNDDRLFVPVENIDLITRFGADDGSVRLDKLGGANWQERKARLKRRIKIAADGLLKIAAERKYKQAPAMKFNESEYEEFCAKFGFAETEDQLTAIEDVIGDLAKATPMDRLVCGDVGFGKTEVALRAAFVAANNNHQVALVCPTTLLSRQHYSNFKKRMAGFGIEVAQISRMVGAADIRSAKAGLKDGKVDIVIGTHALFAENIEYKRLGLLIVDEEQRFGVGQKEKIKKLKSNIHVLTLSATPIPRSLQLAISGIHDLSIIATPPVDRLSVRTFVSPYDELTIKEAILRERNRGGQVFYVVPRIENLEEIYLALRKIVPEATIAQAHGQMRPNELDEIMNQFYDGKFDILLSTTIVESGLDVPNANTIIIHRSDMFGLSQLYQLRGRVGRAKQRGYAYLTLPKKRVLTNTAYKRLEVMQGLDNLGAGFSIASHDMDIRGFGNLLGEEQSGQVKEVGVELYQKMLRETILRLRAQDSAHEDLGDESKFVPNINLGISVLIPDYYVEDLDLRMGLYKRAAQLRDEAEIAAFEFELADRFGNIPQEVLSLLEIMKLKILCLQLGIAKVDVGTKALVLQFVDQPAAKSETILQFVQRNQERVKIKLPNKLLFEIAKDATNELLIFSLEQDLKDLLAMQ